MGNSSMFQFFQFESILPQYDFALLKVDFDKNSAKEWLKNKTSFPFISVSIRQLEMGEPVYSFGYPLSTSQYENKGEFSIGISNLSPRVTSAIVSSEIEYSGMIM